MNELAVTKPKLDSFNHSELATQVQVAALDFNVMDRIRDRISASMAKQLEDTVFECIDARIGPIWNPDEMRGRCRRVSYTFEEYEDYTLDGKIMLRVWPITITRDGLTLTAHRDVQRFP